MCEVVGRLRYLCFRSWYVATSNNQFIFVVLCKESGKEYILELNDTAIGLVHKYADEDMGHIRDVVVSKMNAEFCKSPGEDTNVENEDTKEMQNQIAALRSQLDREKKFVEKLHS